MNIDKDGICIFVMSFSLRNLVTFLPTIVYFNNFEYYIDIVYLSSFRVIDKLVAIYGCHLLIFI